MKHIIRILPFVVVVELVLLLTGVLPPHIAAIAIVITEGTAAILGLSLAAALFAAIRKKVKQGHRVFAAVDEVLKDSLPPKLLWAFKHEIGMFAGIVRLIRGKIDLPPGAIAIKQGQRLRHLCIVLLVVSIIEIVAVELLVPWPVVRIIILVLSIYGMLWLLGFLASTIVYPHYISKNKLVLRFSYYHTIVVPAAAICSSSTEIRTATENKTVVITDNTLELNVMGETNFRVALSEAAEVTHNDKLVQTPLHSVAFQVDDPAVARAALVRS